MKKLAASLVVMACFGMAAPADWAGAPAMPLAAEAARATLLDSDFGYKGLRLGDDVSRMQEVLGEPLFDREQTVQGIPMTVYEYPEANVGVVKATGKVADIALSGKDYTLRRNVRKGATSFWLEKVYGRTERQWRGKVPCYIYERPGHPHEHLLFELDAGEWYLVSTRITLLPLTEEEAERMVIEGWDIEEGLEDAALAAKMGAKDIDTSALPQEDAPRLRIGGKAE